MTFKQWGTKRESIGANKVRNVLYPVFHSDDNLDTELVDELTELVVPTQEERKHYNDGTGAMSMTFMEDTVERSGRKAQNDQPRWCSERSLEGSLYERVATVTTKNDLYPTPDDDKGIRDMTFGELNDLLESIPEPLTYDAVEKPRHYNIHPSGAECITVTQHMNFCLGNAIKYIWRSDEKGNAVQDLEKAIWYLKTEVARRKCAL